MRTSRCIVPLVLAVLAACGRDVATPVAVPDAPLASTWTRTYQVSDLTYTGSGLNLTLSLTSGGYVKVELVPDDPAMGAFEMGRVESGGDVDSFYKPANNSVRITGVPYAGCTFRRFVLGSSPSSTTTTNPINMDNYKVYYQVRGEFIC
ncbi:hypothetical protein [Longimicrobium sp.]|uniref:hypothetical protein n=1 Tax=Longimicrobium sp. TaxID=2029185 RepID=UPI002E34F41A|nr:hypothetical protein [Longimicrobium sp.]HEX6041864.1 hypothetical protein [Longimicrobium sp.]